ncbi:MAG: glycosyltransferase [Candidatus Omnitrophica bacterium]|nr:glycosyltransferase [Candidatus Omnitrophota bacterium]
MNILFLAPRLPYPIDTGGKIRTFHNLKQLALRNNVDLVCFSFNKEDVKYEKIFQDMGINLCLIPATKLSGISATISILFSKQPFAVDKYRSKNMLGMLENLVGQEKYDIVHIDHIHMGQYVSRAWSIPSFIDEHNVEYRILERCADVEGASIKGWLYRAQARKMKSYEKEILSMVKGGFAVSEDDAAILRELTDNKSKIEIIPNGVDTEYFTSENIADENALVFTGSMDWMPNDDAMIYFCEEVLPLLNEKDLKIYIVGKDPSHKLKEFAKKDPQVVVTGRVDDVRTYINKAKIFVVPLRIGGGTRLKILEAMSMEKAVVSTSIGAEGIAYTKGKDIMIADTPEVFANTIRSLLSDTAKQKFLGKNGRELVCSQYDWSIVGKKLNSIYEMVKTNG